MIMNASVTIQLCQLSDAFDFYFGKPVFLINALHRLESGRIGSFLRNPVSSLHQNVTQLKFWVQRPLFM